jgi:outer membrane protein
MKKLVLAVVIILSVGSVIAQQKIAHVNSQKLLDTLPSRKAAIDQLKLFEQNGVQELKEMEADFNKQVAIYEKARPTMSPVIIKIEEEKLMKKQQALEERQQTLNTEMQAVSQELNKPILERVQKAVEVVSDRKKLSYVIDETVTLYFKGGMDITSEVLVELLRMDSEATKK